MRDWAISSDDEEEIEKASDGEMSEGEGSETDEGAATEGRWSARREDESEKSLESGEAVRVSVVVRLRSL